MLQLPSTAQWGSGASPGAVNSTPSLEEIQRLEAEKLKEQEEVRIHAGASEYDSIMT